MMRDFRELLFAPSLFFKRNRVGVANGSLLARSLIILIMIRAFASLFHLSLLRAMIFVFSGIIHDVFSIGSDVIFSALPDWQRIHNYWSGLSYYLVDFGQLMIWPFLLVAKILFGGFFIFLMASYFAPAQLPEVAGGEFEIPKPTFHGVITIIGFAQIPWIFAVIPFLGSLLALVLSVAVISVGLREVYGLTPIRALLAGVFPYILLGVGLLVVIFAGLAVAINVLNLVF